MVNNIALTKDAEKLLLKIERVLAERGLPAANRTEIVRKSFEVLLHELNK